MTTSPLHLGPRLRRLRRELGLTQQAMADDLAVSASYVALMERNQRPVTADMLLRLARTYHLDITDLANENAAAHGERLGAVLRDPLLADIEIGGPELADLALTFPGVAEALLRLHGAFLREQQALAEQRPAIPLVGGREGHAMDDASDPQAQTQRFIASHRHHFPTLEARAEELAAELAEAGGATQWLKRAGVRVRFVSPEILVDAVRRFDRHNRELLLDDTLDGPGRKFHLALHIALTAMDDDITALTHEAVRLFPAAEALVRRALATYAAAALIMPYDRFRRAAEQRRHDIDALCGVFGVSFEHVAHRLTTLGRPGEEGVPFFLVRVDEAGNIAERLDGAGLPFAGHGGGCALWTVHSAFRTPGQIVTQWLDLPDGQRLFSIARTVSAGQGSAGPARCGAPPVLRSIALACAAEHAPALAYAGGLDPQAAPATPIGPSCRVCQRAQCLARSAPPIGRELDPGDQRRATAPFAFAA
jgi:predicted transcriptional regulator/transcriptional regulator with XRE-family HTH domain